MALRVRCQSCGQAIYPFPADPDDDDPQVSRCPCKAIAARKDGGVIIVYHRADGPHGPKPFEIARIR